MGDPRLLGGRDPYSKCKKVSGTKNGGIKLAELKLAECGGLSVIGWWGPLE